MAEYQRSISAPSLGGLQTSPGVQIDRSQDTAAVANSIGQLLGLAAQSYGRNKAIAAGQRVGGEGESFAEAGIAAEQAGAELDIIRARNKEVGDDITADEAADYRKEVFDRVLTNQKRISGALKRGLISSTEATARLNVLRNEALSNPLVAPFQDQLDNALYQTTGGSGSTFAQTAAEVEAATIRKAELAALEETEKQVSGMLQTGVASSRKQALNIIAQQQQHQANMAFYNEKKARLGVTSQEAYAASQSLGTAQASSAYSQISQWISSGGDAAQAQGLRRNFVMEGERVKNAIRAAATGNNGELLVDSDTLSRQLNEVDQRVQDYTRMTEDQSATKGLLDVMAQRTAALDFKNQEIQIELSKLVPLFMAMKDNQVAGQWLWDNSINVNQMRNQWKIGTNPVLKMISKLSPADAQEQVTLVSEKVVKGQVLEGDDAEVAASLLTQRGGTAAVDESFKADPNQTITNLRNIPFSTASIADNNEWIGKAKTPEGKDQVLAIVKGAASRAIVSSITEGARQDSDVNGREQFTAPTSVKVTQEQMTPATSRAGQTKRWAVDTGGIWVSDTYRKEVVNAYKLGTKVPTLWNDNYETIDEWINDLFTRPVQTNQ